MVDNLTKEQRSKCMSHIRSKWTAQERKIHNFLKGYKIKHKMHPNIPGSPDILILESKTAIFLHGCFWHKCPKCFKEPATNRDYWLPKIERNVIRDKENASLLRKSGYKVLVIWEHDVKKNFHSILEKIKIHNL